MKGQFSLKLSPSIHRHLLNIMNPQLQVNSIMPHINLLKLSYLYGRITK
jgi:hypothetical protein